MLAALSRFVYRWRRAILALALAFAGVAIAYGVDALSHLKNGGFEDPACESYRAKETLDARFGRGYGTLVVLYSSKKGLLATDPAFRRAVLASLAGVEGLPDVGSVTSYYSTFVKAFVSNDRRETFAVIALKGDEGKLLELALTLPPRLASDELNVRVGGYPAVFTQMNEQARVDLRRSEMISLPIVAVLLVIIFRSLVASALPLLLGVTTIFGGLAALRLAARWTDVSIYGANVVSMLGLGLAIDYSLFIVSRFREELARGSDVQAALARTMETAGRTVLFSGITVAISLLALEVFPIMFLRSIGAGGAVAVAIAVVSSLTILPALLGVLGPGVDALPVGPRPTAATGREGGFWYRMSLFVMRHAVAIFLVTFVGLAALGRPFLRVHFAIPDARALPEGCESRAVSEELASRFPRNETEPIQVVARADGPVLSKAAISALFDYERTLAAVRGVRRVDSVVSIEPGYGKEDYIDVYTGRRFDLMARVVAPRFANGEYALLSVFYDCPPNSEEAQELVRAVRAVPVPAGLHVEVGGTPAALRDFLHTVAEGVPRAVAIIIAVIFLLLFLMLGSVVIPVKAVVLNILSLSVSFGALVWIFQEGHLTAALGLTALGAIDGSMPVLIFAIAFGLSMDYEVFLLSRIKEHYDRTGDAEEAVARGVEKTGGIITSAALLLVVVIGSFATGRIVFIQQIGIGLGLAILVDATVVRMLLVPAAMRLMGKYNWWAPRRLAELHRRIGLSEAE